MTTEQQALAVAHLSLARAIAHSYVRQNPRLRDEIESAALYGLAQAADRFEPERGWTFATLATRRIRGAILDLFRTENPRGFRRNSAGAPRLVSTEWIVAVEFGRPITLGQTLTWEDYAAA